MFKLFTALCLTKIVKPESCVFPGHVTLMFVITRTFVQYPLPVQSPRLSIPIKSFMRCARNFRALPFQSDLIHFRSLQLRQQTYVQEGSYPMKRAGFLDSLGLTPLAAIANPIWVRFRARLCAKELAPVITL